MKIYEKRVLGSKKVVLGYLRCYKGGGELSNDFSPPELFVVAGGVVIPGSIGDSWGGGGRARIGGYRSEGGGGVGLEAIVRFLYAEAG